MLSLLIAIFTSTSVFRQLRQQLAIIAGCVLLLRSNLNLGHLNRDHLMFEFPSSYTNH